MASDRIALGIIRKAHGVHGEASVEAWTDSPERFSGLREVFLVSPDEGEVRDATVERSREHGGRALVKLAGIDSPEAVAELRNWTIELPESEARKLEENEYFLHDLVGLTLVDLGGNELGQVVDVLEGGGGVLLTVKRGDGTFDVPFAAEICTNVDLGNRRIVVNLPEGLDEV
jgi:16S rRNA processing protein RimM